MKFINNLSVKASWTLVLVTFTCLVLAIGGLGLFANQFGRDAFTSMQQRDMAHRGVRDLNFPHDEECGDNNKVMPPKGRCDAEGDLLVDDRIEYKGDIERCRLP